MGPLNGIYLKIEKVLSFGGLCPEVCLIGCCWSETQSALTELSVQVAGDRFHCLTGLSRDDLALPADSESGSNSGFLVRLPAPSEPVKFCARAAAPEYAEAVFDWDFSSAGIQAEPGESGPYKDWLMRTESAAARSSGSLLPSPTQPTISIILTLENLPLYYLDRSIRSVVRQAYPNWQLCVVDRGSAGARVVRELEKWTSRDPRIYFQQQRCGKAEALNCAIKQSPGEFLVFLDHRDELHPLTLQELACGLNAAPDAGLIYTDEDSIDIFGRRMHPILKPEFDADLLTSSNYIGRLTCLRKERVVEVGVLRPEADESLDWDLLLRLTERRSPDAIIHLAKPLYHQRIRQNSENDDVNALPRSFVTRKRVLEDCLRRRNLSAEIQEGLFGIAMRLRRRLDLQTRVAILWRASDGTYQESALRRVWLPPSSHFFEIFLSNVRPIGTDNEVPHPVFTIDDLNADVLVFINCVLESVNHQFFDELVGQALREDCGIVSGTVVDRHGFVASAGLVCAKDTIVNPFEDEPLSARGYLGMAKTLQSTPAISSHFFAVTSEFARSVFPLSNVAEDTLGALCISLMDASHCAGRKVLHTPYAVATVRYNDRRLAPVLRTPVPPHVKLNRNLAEFGDIRDVLKRGIV